MKNTKKKLIAVWHLSFNAIRHIIFIILALFYPLLAVGQLSPEPMAGFLAGQAVNHSISSEPGLLFYLSGDHKFKADFAAGGQDKPNYLRGLSIIQDGAIGPAFEAADDQLMSYWAPGNIYAQRGTLAFYWRSRYPVGPTPFPIFRVAFADHSSWDMAWLRIDYNGAGFDAFVTDVGLTRTRVSHYMETFPGPGEWTHIAFSWDEMEGVRLYINGKPVEKTSVTGKVFDTGLDQFGPHSRIISPYQVQSLYNFMRGGDMDELRIYDRMLSDKNIKDLSLGKIPDEIPPLMPDLSERRWWDAWWERHGWNLPNDPPPVLPSGHMAIKKVEIHEAYDVKRWMWKANDGIRETTWPGVYNMSRLPGRYDYFVYPDWDCYSMSGQSIRFLLPAEPWNHVEVWGKAWGQLTYEKEHAYDLTFGVRTREQVKSYHRLESAASGGRIRFDNALIEEPIGELGVYNVQEGKAPAGHASETFTLQPAPGKFKDETLERIAAFINGRYPTGEQTKMIGVGPSGNPDTSPEPVSVSASSSGNPLPFIHILIPYQSQPDHGLDGLEIEIPALSFTPTHGELFPMNIRVKDPLWPMRDLADFSFSVKAGTPYTLWIDTRDRILPKDRAFYITLAAAGKGLSIQAMKGLRIRLVYKPEDEAKAEHELDRFTQVRDLFGFTVEEHPSTPRLNLYNRFVADHTDLMMANPEHWLGQAYKYAKSRNIKDRPAYEIAAASDGVPEWAFLQSAYMHRLEKIVSWYIDNRQVSNGEFGGGLSDDDDFSNLFVGAALMGIKPEKIERSLKLLMESYYDQDRDPYHASLRQKSLPLFTNGLSTISADLLHVYEEGIEMVGQMMLIDYGNPIYISRGMEIAKRILEDVTEIAPDGHRHFRSRHYGGTSMSVEDPWQWSGHYSHNVLHTPFLIAKYNGNPTLRKMIIEIADGLLEHRDKEGEFYTEIHFSTGEVRGRPGLVTNWQVLLAAYDFTGDKRYLDPIGDWLGGGQEFNREDLVERYTEKIKDLAVHEYINTEGSIWIDRISANSNDLQTDRLGGIALSRIRNIYPQNHVSWNIREPGSYESLGVFVTKANARSIELLAYNLNGDTVEAGMSLWDIEPGHWILHQGLDESGDQHIDTDANERKVYLERGSEMELSFAPGKYTILKLDLEEPAPTNYADRPDLAICTSGISVKENRVIVRVYSQGAIGSPQTQLELKDAKGKRIATAVVPALEAPLDLIPRYVDITMEIPTGTDLSNGSVEVDPDRKITQITRLNTMVKFSIFR